MGLDVDGENADDDFGHAVALSADGLVLAVGAKNADPGGLSSAGTAAVYDWDSINNRWTRRLPLSRFDGTDAWAHWGESVALSADGAIVAVGAKRSDFAGKTDVGHVEVHEWKNGAWTQLGTDVEGERAADYGGQSVALSADGHVFAVGATLNDPKHPVNIDGNAGHVRVHVYDADNAQWDQRGVDFDGTNTNGGQIGMSMALNADGSVLAIGIPGYSSETGRVRVYAWNNGAWDQLGADGQLDGAAANSGHGVSMALSADGATIAIGDPRYDTPQNNAGCVRVYTYDSGSNQWTQRGQDAQINGNSASQYVGKAVAISADGTIVASTESDGTRVHAWAGNAWTEVGTVLAAEASNDYSYDTMGSLAMSADGTILAVGATENDDGGNGPAAGHVRTYEVQYHA
jgi:hypothetical protein